MDRPISRLVHSFTAHDVLEARAKRAEALHVAVLVLVDCSRAVRGSFAVGEHRAVPSVKFSKSVMPDCMDHLYCALVYKPWPSICDNVLTIEVTRPGAYSLTHGFVCRTDASHTGANIADFSLDILLKCLVLLGALQRLLITPEGTSRT
jgi:hypothetical protein